MARQADAFIALPGKDLIPRLFFEGHRFDPQIIRVSQNENSLCVCVVAYIAIISLPSHETFINVRWVWYLRRIVGSHYMGSA